MSFNISLLNDIAVSIFGSVLSASFCSALTTHKKRRVFWCVMALVPLLLGCVHFIWDAEFMRKFYQPAMHLLLILVLFILTGKLLWPVFSVLAAYLCCELRRWLALLIVAMLSGGEAMQDLVELLLTLPLLLFFLHFVAPIVRPLAAYPAKEQCRFGVIPALYYAFDYLTVVYTDLLSTGDPLIVEFMPFVCCAAYMVFLLYHSSWERTRTRLTQKQKSLDIQLGQAVREIDALRESQTLAGQYRHDMRHHLQYVSACIENGQEEQALAYISGICGEIEAQKVERYCENETVNLILSAFVGRAKKQGVRMNVIGTLPSSVKASDSDLCVLLSNALENALHACRRVTGTEADRVVEVQFYDREGRFFLQVENPYEGEICFENGVPVSHEEGHGIGVQSICAIVERYGGVYTFLARDGKFILRLSL